MDENIEHKNCFLCWVDFLSIDSGLQGSLWRRIPNFSWSFNLVSYKIATQGSIHNILVSL